MKAQLKDAGRGSEGRGFRAIAGGLLLATGLGLLGGCATAKPKVEALPTTPAVVAETAPAPAPAPAQQAESSVTRLSGGREGFVIKESSGMSSAARAEFEQANALIREGNYAKGVELLEKVIVAAPDITAPRINAAIAYQRLEKPEPAEAHLKKALELIPGHPLASNEYGLLLRKAGRFAESRQTYEKSLSLFPEYHPIHRNLGILCDLYLKDQACAVQQYELYAKAMPKDPQVKIWLADLATRTGSNATVKADTGNVLSMAK